MKTLGAPALLFLALAAVAALPAASAQLPEGVTVTPGQLAAPIPYEGSAQLPVSVRVGCLSLAEGATTTVTVGAAAAQPWLTVTPAAIDLAPEGCLTGGGFVTGTGEVGLAVSKDAPGVVDHVVNLTADLGGDPAPATFTVAYHVNYTLVPDVTFPLAVTGTEATFNVTVTQASNARSMVMMEEQRVSTGTLSGAASEVYENDAGKPASKTFRFTYRPPSGEWTNATASLTAYGHYLLTDGRAGDFDNGTVMTFAFSNAAPEDNGGGGGKDSPAPAGALLALGLVALAALVRRKA